MRTPSRLGFAAVEHEGVRSGLHGLMVAVIKDFSAEVFEDVDNVPLAP
jgi:hypothetical protein